MSNSVILLCGGAINYSNLPIATNVSNAMIPVNGKPVIGWILDDLNEKGLTDVTIVAQRKNRQLHDFVKWAFAGRMQVRFAFVEKGNIIHSLLAGLEVEENMIEANILLGDTLIKDEFPQQSDYVLVSADYDDPRNWCLAEVNDSNVIQRFYDKQNLSPENSLALTGFYRFQDAELLKKCSQEAILDGKKELSDVLHLYKQTYPIKAVPTRHWYDFGHISHFLQAKRDMLQSRYFNHLVIHGTIGTIEKISEKTQKLEDEYHWFLSLPPALQTLTPRIISRTQNNGSVSLVQEYYGYPNMAELYLFGNLDVQIWKTAVKNLLQTHHLLCQYPGEVSAEDARHIYWEKTEERLESLIDSDPFFQEIISMDTLVINGKTLRNLPLLKPEIKRAAISLSADVRGCIIHGDFCLSNILYDINNQIVRLIDPRGSFGKRGIYGDPRYDMAKLRHSLAGGYDYILSDLFSFQRLGENEFQKDLFHHELYEDIARLLDAEIVKAGYLLDEIVFIEALLFLSMIPLHRDRPNRQVMMYLRAIELFNQYFHKVNTEKPGNDLSKLKIAAV